MSSVHARRSTPIIPFVAPVYAHVERYAYTLIRVAIGAIFIPHGVQKLIVGNYGLGILELLGGIALMLGILVRPAALLLIFNVAAIIVANFAKGWLWTRGGVQYHSFLLGMLLAVLIGGPGRYALAPWLNSKVEGFLGSMNERLVPIAYAFARIYYALVIIPSGYEKVFHDGAARIAAGNVLKTGFYPPLFWAWVVAYLEFFGMIMLALGLLTRPIAFAFAIEMAVITVMVQMPNGYFWTSRGAEFALILFLVCVAFVIGGGGRYSLDRRIGKEF